MLLIQSLVYEYSLKSDFIHNKTVSLLTQLSHHPKIRRSNYTGKNNEFNRFQITTVNQNILFITS